MRNRETSRTRTEIRPGTGPIPPAAVAAAQPFASADAPQHCDGDRSGRLDDCGRIASMCPDFGRSAAGRSCKVMPAYFRHGRSR